MLAGRVEGPVRPIRRPPRALRPPACRRELFLCPLAQFRAAAGRFRGIVQYGHQGLGECVGVARRHEQAGVADQRRHLADRRGYDGAGRGHCLQQEHRHDLEARREYRDPALREERPNFRSGRARRSTPHSEAVPARRPWAVRRRSDGPTGTRLVRVGHASIRTSAPLGRPTSPAKSATGARSPAGRTSAGISIGLGTTTMRVPGNAYRRASSSVVAPSAITASAALSTRPTSRGWRSLNSSIFPPCRDTTTGMPRRRASATSRPSRTNDPPLERCTWAIVVDGSARSSLRTAPASGRAPHARTCRASTSVRTRIETVRAASARTTRARSPCPRVCRSRVRTAARRCNRRLPGRARARPQQSGDAYDKSRIRRATFPNGERDRRSRAGPVVWTELLGRPGGTAR